MNCLFRCHQCSYEEWRPEDREPWLCLVCGYMRWSAIADDGPAVDPDFANTAADSGDLEQQKNH